MPHLPSLLLVAIQKAKKVSGGVRTWTMSDMVKYRAAIWSFLRLTALYFTMSDIASPFVSHCHYVQGCHIFNFKCNFIKVLALL